MLEDFLHE
jgi:hypothetical protein